VARQVGAAAGEFDHYDWQGRQIQRHRAQIRELTGFREPTVTDAAKLTEWLTDEVCRAEPREDRVRDELLARCREELLEPPGPTRIARIVGSAMRQAEQALTTHIAAGIPVSAAARIRVLRGEADTDPVDGGDGGVEVFAQIRTDPGNVSLNTCVEEVSKLEAVRAIGLPTTLFIDVAPKMLVAWRSRVAVETPSLLRDHPDELKLTLLAAYLHCRQRELTDTLVDLLIATVHRINARAETKVVGEFVTELKRVAGKENILFRITEAALDGPNETCVRRSTRRCPVGWTP
jgi:hypothetical protein